MSVHRILCDFMDLHRFQGSEVWIRAQTEACPQRNLHSIPAGCNFIDFQRFHIYSGFPKILKVSMDFKGHTSADRVLPIWLQFVMGSQKILWISMDLKGPRFEAECKGSVALKKSVLDPS